MFESQLFPDLVILTTKNNHHIKVTLSYVFLLIFSHLCSNYPERHNLSWKGIILVPPSRKHIHHDREGLMSGGALAIA